MNALAGKKGVMDRVRPVCYTWQRQEAWCQCEWGHSWGFHQRCKQHRTTAKTSLYFDSLSENEWRNSKPPSSSSAARERNRGSSESENGAPKCLSPREPSRSGTMIEINGTVYVLIRRNRTQVLGNHNWARLLGEKKSLTCSKRATKERRNERNCGVLVVLLLEGNYFHLLRVLYPQHDKNVVARIIVAVWAFHDFYNIEERKTNQVGVYDNIGMQFTFIQTKLE